MTISFGDLIFPKKKIGGYMHYTKKIVPRLTYLKCKSSTTINNKKMLLLRYSDLLNHFQIDRTPGHVTGCNEGTVDRSLLHVRVGVLTAAWLKG